MVGILWISGSSLPTTIADSGGGIHVDVDPPQWTYTGTANLSAVEWEVGGSFNAAWDLTDQFPNKYTLFWNQSGSNTTYTSGDWTTSVSGTYNPALSDVGNIIFFNLYANDTQGNTNSSIVLFSVINTNPPTIQITQPTNRTYTDPTIEITLTSPSYDAAIYQWALYWGNGTLKEGNVTWITTVERTLDDGTYSLRGFVNDTAGLEASAIVCFTMAAEVLLQGGQSGYSPDTPEELEAEYGLPTEVKARGSIPIIIAGAGLFFIVWYIMEKRDKEQSPTAVRNAYKDAKDTKKQEAAFNSFWRYYDNNKKKKKKRRNI